MRAAPLDPVDTVAYVRVSTEDQARDEKTSLADQRAAVAALAVRLGRVLEAAHVYEDAGVSGQSSEGRPAFTAMMRYCLAHPRPARAPGVVLVLNDSRFGRFRRPSEAIRRQDELEEAGWFVRFAESDEPDDVHVQHILRAVRGSTASQYSHQLRANTKRGVRANAKDGRWMNEAPMGYRRLATGGGRDPVVLEPGQRKADDQVVRLTPGPEDEQAIVRWAFTAYASGEWSQGQLATELQRRWPHRKWSRPCVQALLKNPAYAGDVVWCRRPHDKWERKELRGVRPRSEWVITRDAHPPLVSRELFAAVQRRLEERRRTVRRSDRAYVLSGLLTCAHCGKPYIGGGGTKGPADDPDRYRFYKCSGSDRNVCPGRMGTLIRRWIEPRVIDVVAREVARPEVQRAIAAAVDQVLATMHDTASGRARERDRRRGELEAERERLVGAIARGVLSDTEAAARLDAIRRELEALARSAERSRFEARAQARLEEERDRLIVLAADFAARARQLEGAALRELLAPWIRSAVVDKERRVLTMEIRRVPETAVLGDRGSVREPSDTTRRPASRPQRKAGVVRRTVALYPQRRAPKRAAGGAR